MSHRPVTRRRARPVADAPVLDGAVLAKAWLVELVADAPLERATRLPGPRFADDAPALCVAIGDALADDGALAELGPGGRLAPLAAGAAALAAADTAPDAVAALDALRAVVWEEVQAALDRPGGAQVAELADRLGAVLAVLTAAVLGATGAAPAARPGDRGPLAAVLRRQPADPPETAPEERASRPPDEEPDLSPATPTAADEAGRADEEPDASPVTPTAADEAGRADEEPRPPGVVEIRPEPPADGPRAATAASPRAVPAAQRGDPLAGAVARLRALGRRPGPAQVVTDPFDAASSRLRDTVDPAYGPSVRRLDHGDADPPWSADIAQRLARHGGAGRPFAVLCVELVDAERLLASDEDAEAAVERAEAAVLGALRPADALVRERPGRLWLTAPDTDASDARALAHRIAAAVAATPAARGAALEAVLGVATHPADADDAAGLEARAEEGLFAARAAGLRVAGPPRA